ncbi:MAG: DegT/DnrJ/EryC1/StrS family aminotransferase [Acutalibacteraceae bacterium]|nr:DegT/DnrJ/EryC1/StrS family aminotransferase [Acutalibacteraceae bacterium]
MRKIPFSPPDITEEEISAVCDTLRSGWITTGPKTKQFEKEITEYCGSAGCACLSSATAALECTLRILGIGEGDEVIVPAYTYTATASVVCHVGAKLVMCDLAPDSFFMDYEKLRSLINEKTKAIIPVDIAGVMCDYDKIFAICEEKKSLFCPKNDLQKVFGRIIVVADGAHSFGADKNGKKAGFVADFTCFSFHAVKNLTTAEGGAAVWAKKDFLCDESLYKQFMLQSLHGQNKDALAKTKLGAWEYDIAAPLYKCNMTDIMASVGLVQLKRYDEMLKKRRRFIEIYNEILSDERFMPIRHYDEKSNSSGHLYLLRIKGVTVNERNEIIEKMAQRGIATNVHYKPLPMLTAYKNLGFDISDYPNAYNQFCNEITLPLNTKMNEEDVRYTAEKLVDILKEY